jgi:colanic acid biosynthesis glycosyl transferase WcaI
MIAASRSVDLVVAASPPLLGAAAAGWFARLGDRPSLILAYDLVTDIASDAFGMAGGALGQLMRHLEANLYARASHVIALSHDMAERIRELSHRTSPISVIRIWADDELVHLDCEQAGRDFRARFRIPESQRLIGFAGSFGRKQRLTDIALALRELPSDFTVLFVGDGPDRIELERITGTGPADMRVLQPLSTPDLHAFLSACDLSVVIAWTQHAGSLFPSKVANILAAGSPVMAVAPAGTELARLVEGECLGIVCPGFEASMVVDAVRKIVDAGRDSARRTRCRRFAQTHLGEARATASFLSEVNHLVGL